MKPADSTLARTGGQLLIDALKVHGVDMVFGVPGESYLDALDAFYDARDDIKFVICRQEGGAANMADAYGKLTGRPGICFVTRGPGATNASIGIHTAFQDSTPVILLIGQVSTKLTEREAFQEMDYRRMYGQMAKWVAQIDRPERVPEMLSHAFHLAVSGRPGPVVLALPEDMQSATATVADTARYQRVAAHPGADDMNRLRDMLAQAQRPFVMLGGGGWNQRACDDIQAFVAANALPAGCTYRCQDLLDNRHPNYVGDIAVGLNPALESRIRTADLLLAIGPRLGEWTTINYTLIDIPRPQQKFIHVHAGAEELGRVYQGDLLINSGMPEFAAAARRLVPVKAAWADATKAARAEYEAWQKPVAVPAELAGMVNDPLDLTRCQVFARPKLGVWQPFRHNFPVYDVWASALPGPQSRASAHSQSPIFPFKGHFTESIGVEAIVGKWRPVQWRPVQDQTAVGTDVWEEPVSDLLMPVERTAVFRLREVPLPTSMQSVAFPQSLREHPQSSYWGALGSGQDDCRPPSGPLSSWVWFHTIAAMH